MRKLSQSEEKETIKAIQALETHPVCDSCSKGVFKFEENGVIWQLQVKIVRDPYDFLGCS